MADPSSSSAAALLVVALLHASLAATAAAAAAAAASPAPHFDPLVVNKLDQVAYTYPNKAEELGVCEEDEVCNVVHNRPWYLPRVDRYCNCPGTKSCSTSTSTRDSKSIRLNDRAVLKMCQDTWETEPCGELEAGLSEERKEDRVTVKVSCTCPWPGYWRLDTHKYNNTYSFSSYHCTKLRACEVEEFCGYLRADTFSFYLQCICPSGTHCSSFDTRIYTTSEALFTGSSLKGFCRPTA